MVCDYAGNNNSFNDVCDGGWQTMQITELISFLKILGKFWSDKRQEKKKKMKVDLMIHEILYTTNKQKYLSTS